MRAQYVLRIRVLVGLVILVAVLILGRLYMLQVVHGAEFRQEANGQYVRSARDIFDRGSIFFTQKNGERIAAASLKSGYMLAINPSTIADIDATYRGLSTTVEIPRDVFYQRASKKDDPYEEIARHIEPEDAKKIEELDLADVHLFREQWRYYPGDTLAAHVLGFVGFNGESPIATGRYGLERYWESVLARQRDRLHVNFFAEVFTNVSDVMQDKEIEHAGDLITSIEPTVQHSLEIALLGIQEKWNARQMAGIIMDPRDGKIYALATLPSYSPNTYFDEEDPRVFRNPLVEDVHEMGSIIKPIAMAIGLDTDAVTAETTYNDKGQVTIDTATIRNYDERARGVVNMQEVLNQSLNTGMAFVAKQTGGEVMGERMRTFGFGEETGIDLPFEVRGLIDNLTSPREVEYATASFGQGIALTPIATVRALSALGNGGYLVTPHLVRSIEYEDGDESKIAPDDRVQVLLPETSEEITRMLVNVVDDALRGGTVKKDHHSIAAKTGTAQIAKKGERGYYEDRFLHSFFGYFPAYDPQFIIFLYHIEPQGARYASETLTEPFMDLVDFLINYYQIPPDR